MKKKYLLTFIISIVSFFCFIGSGEAADSCNYYIPQGVFFDNPSASTFSRNYIEYRTYIRTQLEKYDENLANERPNAVTADEVRENMLYQTVNYLKRAAANLNVPDANNEIGTVKISFDIENGKPKNVIFSVSSKYGGHTYNFSNRMINQNIDFSSGCPDLIVVDINGRSLATEDGYQVNFPNPIFTTDARYQKIPRLVGGVYIKNGDIDAATTEAEKMYNDFIAYGGNTIGVLKVILYNESNSSNASILQQQRSCIVQSLWNKDYTQKDNNINNIISKYLENDEFKNFLNSMFSDNQNDKIELDPKILTEIYERYGATTILEDTKKLAEFNNSNIQNCSTKQQCTFLHSCFGNYSSMKSWLEYYPNNSENYILYAEFLYRVFTYPEFQDLLKFGSDLENVDNRIETLKKCNGMETCCLNYAEMIAEINCASVPSAGQSYCYRGVKDNSFKECQNFPKEEYNKEIMERLEREKQEIEEKLKAEKESLGEKTFKFSGVEIDNNELCDILFKEDSKLYGYIKGLLNLIRIGGPILIVFLTAYDAIKMITSFKDEENKKFFSHLKLRLICLALLLLIPTIIIYLTNILENQCKDIENILK